MSELTKLIQERTSVRQYLPDAVPQDLIDQVVEAGIYAPSGMNRQPVKIVAITDPEWREEVRKENAAVMGSTGDPFYGAPAILLIIADKASPTAVYDGSLALGYMMLKAQELGLGTCWIHRAKQEMEGPFGEKLLKTLGLTGEYEGVGHLAIGYCAGEKPAPKPRAEGRSFLL